MRRLLLTLLIAGALAATAGAARLPAAPAPRVSGAPRCPVFPPDNPWNQRVDRLPVDPNSAKYIAAIGLDAPAHPDFGTVYAGAPNGIPHVVVSNRTPPVPVHFQYAAESYRGPYPIPKHAPIQGATSSSGVRDA